MRSKKSTISHNYSLSVDLIRKKSKFEYKVAIVFVRPDFLSPLNYEPISFCVISCESKVFQLA